MQGKTNRSGTHLFVAQESLQVDVGARVSTLRLSVLALARLLRTLPLSRQESALGRRAGTGINLHLHEGGHFVACNGSGEVILRLSDSEIESHKGAGKSGKSGKLHDKKRGINDEDDLTRQDKVEN